jgi:hypothetical protein
MLASILISFRHVYLSKNMVVVVVVVVVVAVAVAAAAVFVV